MTTGARAAGDCESAATACDTRATADQRPAGGRASVRDPTLIDSVREVLRETKRIPNRPRRALVLSEWAFRTMEERIVDLRYRRLGLDTSDPDPHMPDATAELRRYVPTEWSVLRQLVPRGSLGPEDVLLDYGSGKGRVTLWAASRFPLRRVIGVEYNCDYVAVASSNVQRWRGPLRCNDVVLTCADARTYDVPDDVTAVFMYNPFMGTAFEQVLARLQQSLRRRPRDLQIFYYIPIMHTALIEAGFSLERVRRHELYAWGTYRIG